MNVLRACRPRVLAPAAALLLGWSTSLFARDVPKPAAAEAPVTTAGPVLAVNSAVPAERDIDARLEAPRTELAAQMQQVVGRSARALGRQDGLLGNLVTDVMRSHAEHVTGQPIDVAFTNVGGLRATLPAGALTRGAVMSVLPFENTLVVLDLKGADLQSVLDRSAMHGGDPISGARYSVRDRKAVDAQVGGQPLDPQRIYRLCTTDFIMDGGGRFEALKHAARVNRTGVLLRDALLDYLADQERAGRPVDVHDGPRVKALDAPAAAASSGSHP